MTYLKPDYDCDVDDYEYQQELLHSSANDPLNCGDAAASDVSQMMQQSG